MKFVERATRVLNERKIIAAISKLAHEKIGSEISICFPKLSKERDNIYFIIDKPNVDTVNLSVAILRILDFDYEDADEKGDVIILNKQFHSQQTISTYVEDEDVTLFTPENYDNIHAFLKKHYHPDLKKDTDVIAHQDKRQRSVSPPPNSSFFPQNDSRQQDEVKLPTPEMVAEYLHQAPWWEKLRGSPEKASVLEQGCKRALIEEHPSTRPTGAAV